MRRLYECLLTILLGNPVFCVKLLYGDFWKLREACIRKRRRFIMHLYYAYLEHFGAWIGLGATINTPPQFPHGLHGVFISNTAVIGKNVCIYQQVCIGSNELKDSKGKGAPTIKDNVFIGVGAKIIGNVTIGENSRIGAGCVVAKDTPPNSVTVIIGIKSVVKEYRMNNTID